MIGPFAFLLLVFSVCYCFARFVRAFFLVLMSSVVLVRGAGSDEGMAGKLFLNGKFFCHSLELPWRNNQPSVSCVPVGVYECTWVKSPRFGWVYALRDVPGRTHILMHAGNWAGNGSLGFRSDVEGCILLGQKAGRLLGQRAVLSSRLAVQRFAIAMQRRKFLLTILDGVL